MTQKQFDALLNPMRKLESVAESNAATLCSIELLTVSGNTIAAEQLSETKKQTSLLTEIKEHINELVVAKRKEIKEQSSGAGGFKFTGVMGIKVALFMVAASIGIAAASNILSFTADVSPKQLATAALIAVAFIPMTDAFLKIYRAIKPVRSNTAILLGMANKNIGALSGNRFKPDEGAQGMNAKTALGFTIGSMIAMGAGVMIVSYLLKMMAVPSIEQVLTAALIGASLVPLTKNLMMILKTLNDNKIKANKEGIKQLGMGIITMGLIASGFVAIALIMQLYPKATVTPDITFAIVTGIVLWIYSKTFGNIIKSIGRKKPKTILMAAGVMVLLALTAVGVAYAFSMYPGDPANMPGVGFALLSGLVLFTFSFSFALLAKTLGRVSFRDMGKAVVSMALVAVAIVGVAYIFQYLAGVGAYVAPPVKWALSSGLALAVFTIGFGAVALLVKMVGMKGMLMGLLGVAVIALGILATAWIFSLLPDTFAAPPIDWTLKTMVAMALFAIPIAIIGAIAMSGAGAAAILLGVVGMIVIAAGIWVVAWIFSKLPDLTDVSSMLTDALLTPVNGIVDVLARLKNEVGVENLLPLAGGIVAIAGSLLVLAAAAAGTAAAGVFSALGNAVTGIIDWFSGEETKGPLDILKDLIAIAPMLPKISAPLEIVAGAMSESGVGGLVDRLVEVATAIKGVAESSTSPMFMTAVDKLERVAELRFNNQAKDLEALAKAYGKIADTTNKINIDAMDSTTNMFKALAYLSENGGKTAIEALGENLIDAVEELASMIADFEGTVSDQVQSNSGLSSSIGGFTDKISSGFGLFGGGFDQGQAGPADNAELARQMKKLVQMLQTGDAKIIISDMSEVAAEKLA